MKVILYMATSANGYIAGENDNVEWVSEVSWNSYLKKVKEIGCVIIGRKTYDLMPTDEFVKGVRYIVLTKKVDLLKKAPNIEFSSKKPKELLESLQKEGIKEACICGGGEINTAFMKENLIDEIYLDIEPIILGKGIKLFAEQDFESKLELIETTSLSRNEVQLHYKIIK